MDCVAVSFMPAEAFGHSNGVALEVASSWGDAVGVSFVRFRGPLPGLVVSAVRLVEKMQWTGAGGELCGGSDVVSVQRLTVGEGRK